MLKNCNKLFPWNIRNYYIPFYLATGSVHFLSSMLYVKDFLFLCSDRCFLMYFFAIQKHSPPSFLLARLQCRSTWDFSITRLFLVSDGNQAAAAQVIDKAGSFLWPLWEGEGPVCFQLPTDFTSIVSTIMKLVASVR